MSYDATVFLSGPDSLEAASTLFTQLTGLPMVRADTLAEYRAEGLGIRFELMHRPERLSSAAGRDLSAFQLQLDLGNSHGVSDLIHPISFHLAKTISRVSSCEALVFFAGIEIFAAEFVRGVLKTDELAAGEARVGAGSWAYRGKALEKVK